MRRYLTIVLGCTLLIGAKKQYVTAGYAPVGGASCVKTDNFAGTGALNATYWTTPLTGSGINDTLTRGGGVAVDVSGSVGGMAIYTGCTFGTTQSAQAVVVSQASTSNINGPIALMQINGTGYVWLNNTLASGQPSEIIAISNGAFNNIPAPTIVCPKLAARSDVISVSTTVSAGLPTITCTDVTTSTSGYLTDPSPVSITGFPGIIVQPGDSVGSFVAGP